MLKCPKCGCEYSRVIDSRSSGDGTRRRRECESCGSRYTTYEACDDITKKSVIKQLVPILTRNIREALQKTIREIRE